MQRLRQKRPRFKLGIEEYNLLRQRVLERDGWRCQNCGSSKDLHAHHLVKRSKLGDDALENLIRFAASVATESGTIVISDSSRPSRVVLQRLQPSVSHFASHEALLLCYGRQFPFSFLSSKIFG